MHVYLIVSEDKLQAFVFSNVDKAKEKEKEIGNAYVFEWLDLWCIPLEFGVNQIEEGKFNDTRFPWKMLVKAYEDEHWYARAKYRNEIFDYKIKMLQPIRLGIK